MNAAVAETRRTAVEPPMLVVVGAEVWRTWTAVTAEIHEWLSAAAAQDSPPKC
jgi:hypothetical protein